MVKVLVAVVAAAAVTVVMVAVAFDSSLVKMRFSFNCTYQFSSG